jgi:hypothetical protein
MDDLKIKEITKKKKKTGNVSFNHFIPTRGIYNVAQRIKEV